MVLAFLHAKHSKSITRVQIASRFLPWNTRDTARSRFAGETPARSVTCIPTEKGRRELNVSDAVFLPFSDGESQLSIGSMVQRYKSDQKSAPIGRVGRSVGRESCWSVHGWVAQVDKNYHIRQELFCPTTSLEC